MHKCCALADDQNCNDCHNVAGTVPFKNLANNPPPPLQTLKTSQLPYTAVKTF